METAVEKTKQDIGKAAARFGGKETSWTDPPLHPMLQLQQQAGNQAVQELLRSRIIQAKLAISQPNDPEEQEADRVADRIMRSHAGAGGTACSCASTEETCEECRQKSSGTISRKATNSGSTAATNDVVSRVLHSPGQLMDGTTRAIFEPRFGRDFSNVRVHTGPEAEQSARAIHARAYTAGENVVFAPGEFRPESTEGRKLLAHELVHVVQRANAQHMATKGEVVTPVFRQVTTPPGSPAGPDPCRDLIQRIIELLDEVARRIRDAEDDNWDLFKFRPHENPDYPGGGTWDGHRKRFYEDRQELDDKIKEWDGNDDCRNYRLNPKQEEDLKEAREYKDKKYPEKPLKAMRDTEEELSFRQKIAEALRKAGIPAWAAAGLITLIVAALADPEPFSKVALLLGAAGAVIFFAAIGRSKDAPPSA